MNDTIAAGRDYWKRRAILNPRGATANEIDAFERHHGVILAPLVREYFEVLNGTGSDAGFLPDEALNCFWHLDRLKTVSAYRPGLATPLPGKYFIFADYSIDGWLYALRLSNDPQDPSPVIFVGDSAHIIAGSFHEFLKIYIHRGPQAIYDHED